MPPQTERAQEDDRPFAEIRRNLQDGLRMLSLHRWTFFIPFCIVTSGAFILSLYYPRTYSAKTSFERRNDPILADLSLSQGAATFKLFRTTIGRDLTSTEHMIEVVENLGLTKDFERDENGELTPASIRQRTGLAHTLGSGIRITTRTPNEHTDIVNIKYTGPDPKIGKKLLDEVKATYIRRTMEWVQQHLEGLRDYYVAEAAEALKNLRAAEAAQTQLRLDNPFLNPQNPGAISGRISQLELTKSELVRRRREYMADLEAQRQMLASVESQIEAQGAKIERDREPVEVVHYSPQARRLLEEIAEIDSKIDELKVTRGMTDAHPEIQEMLTSRRWREAELSEQQVHDHETAVTNVGLDAVSAGTAEAVIELTGPWQSDRARILAQIAAQEAKIKETDISIESNKQETDQLNDAMARIFDLQEAFADAADRVSDTRREHSNVTSILARIEPAIKANEQDRLLHWSIGEPAQGGIVPVNPKARTVVLLALLAGIAAGVLFVVLAEVLDHVYRSSGQVLRSLGLPILDAVDEIVTSQDRRRILVRRTVITPLLLVSCLGFTGAAGAMAYLSIQRPQTYGRVQEIPRAALDALVGETQVNPVTSEAPGTTPP